ncbi:MAG: hypothetical protein COZ23_01835 [Hydrogenophilales bacterium CG_4_10_14_3_um_filter_58_23]|nr:MAG: hypothetical protein COZ23_01835 [Hydrogenophilales bacterium CG_4_10_14_3_um_filter_58_23]
MITLADYIAARLNAPFQWGVNDCMTFAVGWAEIAGGRTLLPKRLWHTELQAARLIKRHGGLVAALDAHFGQIHPNYAKDGDIAIADGVVALISGAHLVAPGADGLVFKPRTEADHAWSV